MARQEEQRRRGGEHRQRRAAGVRGVDRRRGGGSRTRRDATSAAAARDDRASWPAGARGTSRPPLLAIAAADLRPQAARELRRDLDAGARARARPDVRGRRRRRRDPAGRSALVSQAGACTEGETSTSGGSFRASRMTSVPAARSPSRWFRCVTRIEMIPTRYVPGRRSMMRMTFRTALGANVTGAPDSRTTRSPFTALPGVRPELSTSKATS